MVPFLNSLSVLRGCQDVGVHLPPYLLWDSVKETREK